jgi:hypothetical protein
MKLIQFTTLCCGILAVTGLSAGCGSKKDPAPITVFVPVTPPGAEASLVSKLTVVPNLVTDPPGAVVSFDYEFKAPWAPTQSDGRNAFDQAVSSFKQKLENSPAGDHIYALKPGDPKDRQFTDLDNKPIYYYYSTMNLSVTYPIIEETVSDKVEAPLSPGAGAPAVNKGRQMLEAACAKKKKEVEETNGKLGIRVEEIECGDFDGAKIPVGDEGGEAGYKYWTNVRYKAYVATTREVIAKIKGPSGNLQDAEAGYRAQCAAWEEKMALELEDSTVKFRDYEFKEVLIFAACQPNKETVLEDKATKTVHFECSATAVILTLPDEKAPPKVIKVKDSTRKTTAPAPIFRGGFLGRP